MIVSGRASGRLLAVPALLAGVLLPSICQATLVGPGDLAFIRFNADGFDDFAIVLLADADVGQMVSFNNAEYQEGLGEFGSGKHFVWEVTEALSAGTVVTFFNLDRFSQDTQATAGTIQNPGRRMLPLDAAGATIHAYLGTDPEVPGTILAGISSESSSAFDGTGLVLGESAIYLPPQGDEADEAHYIGDRTSLSSYDDYLPLIGNLGANWVVRGNTVPPNFPAFDPSNFTLQNSATVPESPAVVILGALMMLTCLMVGARWRRPTTVAIAE